MALLNEVEKAAVIPRRPRRFKHDAMFSYASKDAEYVRAVHKALPKEVDAFDYADGGMWGEDLVKGLERRYKNEAPFCVVFISEAYLASPWTRKELGIVQSVAKDKPGYMLPVVLDGTIVPEIKDIVWLDKTLTPEQLAARLVAKIQEPPPKPWWFYLSTGVWIAVAAVVLALILFTRPAVNYFRPSRTAITAVNASPDAVSAHVVNSGPKSAVLVGQRLKFGALPIEDQVLRLDKAESPTIAPGHRDLKLTALGLVPKCVDGHFASSSEIEPLLLRNTVTIELDVRESDDAPGTWTPRVLHLPATRLQPFVGKVPNDNPPC